MQERGKVGANLNRGDPDHTPYPGAHQQNLNSFSQSALLLAVLIPRLDARSAQRVHPTPRAARETPNGTGGPSLELLDTESRTERTVSRGRWDGWMDGDAMMHQCIVERCTWR
ncbi:hypothetical protein LIA77_01540 [Sarocladium implicatum]|nr:hypothetical protein LIA77_01540 [Sarocladium implicatum]